MLLRDALSNNPESLFMGCIVWIPLAIWIWALMSWTIQGDIDFLSGLAGFILAMGVGLVAISTHDPNLPKLIFVAVVLTLAAFPIIRSVLNKHILNAIEVDAIERSYELLSEKPGNPALQFRLAKNLYSRAMIGPAIALAEAALVHLPRAQFEEEHKILRDWQRSAAGKHVPPAYPCFECGAQNENGLTHCKKCGSPFLLEYAKGKWVGRGVARKIVAAWGALMIAIVGIPWASMSLPPIAAILVIIVLMIVAVLLLVSAFRTKETPLAA